MHARRLICPRTLSAPRSQQFSERVARLEEPIISKNRYSNIFLSKMEAIVFIILQIFFSTRAILKIRTYPRIFRNFKTAVASIWDKNMLGYLSLNIICSSKLSVFRERSSRKTVRFSEQIIGSLSNGDHHAEDDAQ